MALNSRSGAAAEESPQRSLLAAHAVKEIFFDYDSTVTRPVFVEALGKWAISDKPEVCLSLSPEQLVQQFGGEARIKILHSFFKRLQHLGVVCHIVSHGREGVITHQLEKVRLHKYFETVVASDSEPLRAVGNDKGAYILRCLQRKGARQCFGFWPRCCGGQHQCWHLDPVPPLIRAITLCILAAVGLHKIDGLFVDDSERNIITALKVCRVYVVPKPCLGTLDMQAIATMCVRG